MFFFSSRRRHTRSLCDWSSDVCSSDLEKLTAKYRSPPFTRGDHSVSSGGCYFRPCKQRHPETEVVALMAEFLPSTWLFLRSEERRVGKECRSRRLRYH